MMKGIPSWDRRRGPAVHATRSMVMSTLLRSAIVAVVITVGSIGHEVFSVLPWAVLPWALLLILTLDLVAGSLLGSGTGKPEPAASRPCW